MELGNGYAGDSIYIKAGDVDILVDAGSKNSSASTIMEYVDDYVADKKFEYVIATHYDKDHISAFFGTSKDNGVLDNYKCDVIIDAPKSTKTTKTYTNYVKKRDELVKNGTKHYTALDCYNNENGASRKYELTDEIELEILYNYYYDHETTDENNNSVCFLINQGDRHFLFTGDLEKEGEARQEELALAYPSFLARLTLLAQTGMPIRQIFARLSKEKNGVVYEEVRRTFREMESGMTQTEALERFGKRTRLPQYKKCAALLAQNIRRGTGELITALGQEAENAFEEQKAAARRKAEEAQTKLLFPMLLMLSVVMILILVPAWLSFGGL